MNAEQAAVKHAEETLTEILGNTEVPQGKIKRWQRKHDGMYYWKCYCGFGMRYGSEQAMRTASLKHKMNKHHGVVSVE